MYPFDGRPAAIAFTPVAEGSTIQIGDGSVRACHTPGHTEGSVTFLAGNAALTGDFIFVQSVGRPDLGGKSAEWTPVLWNSLERARREWSPDTRIYPAHYASQSEREPDQSVGRPFGRVLESNAPLQIRDREEFLAWVGSKIGNAPDNYKKIKAVNLGLLEVWDMEAQALEGGRNECALS